MTVQETNAAAENLRKIARSPDNGLCAKDIRHLLDSADMLRNLQTNLCFQASLVYDYEANAKIYIDLLKKIAQKQENAE